jgi:Mce-associated membrane protein
VAVDVDSADRIADERERAEPIARDARLPDNSDVSTGDDDEAVPVGDDGVHPYGDDGREPSLPRWRRLRGRQALIAGTAIVTALGVLVAWLGVQVYRSGQVQAEQALFLQVGRQTAINLTTIDYVDVEANVRRILDSATGSFHDEFQQRSQPFIDVVKQTQSVSEGTVVAAALESAQGDTAQVLVAVTVKTANVAGGDQDPRRWRMRIGVSKVGDGAKASNVEFVP